MKKDNTLQELILGIVFVGIVEQILCLIFFENQWYLAKGIWSGILIGVGMSIHMKRSIEDALDLGEDGAVKYIRKTYALRFVIVAIVMGCVIYFDFGHPLALLAGIAALKIGAYLQPHLHKVLQKFK